MHVPLRAGSGLPLSLLSVRSMQSLTWAIFAASRCETNGLRRAAAQLVTDLLDCAALLLSPASKNVCTRLCLIGWGFLFLFQATLEPKQALGATPHSMKLPMPDMFGRITCI